MCDFGSTLLMATGIYGHVVFIKDLLSRIPTVGMQYKHGSTELLLGSEEAYSDVVKVLLKSNANVNIKDGESALNFTSFEEYVEVVKQLLDQYPNIDIEKSYGYGAWIRASKTGSRRSGQDTPYSQKL